MVRRRTLLRRGLALLLLGFSRRLTAQSTPVRRYHPLARPTVVPLADLATPLRARPFAADAVTLASAANPNQPIRVSGMIVRTAAGGNRPEVFSALCVRCPHEGCDVDFLSDPTTLPPEVLTEIGKAPGALYICPCHNSAFDAIAGERLAGPAPRGLYRFMVTRVTDAVVEIAEVEEDVLIFV